MITPVKAMEILERHTQIKATLCRVLFDDFGMGVDEASRLTDLLARDLSRAQEFAQLEQQLKSVGPIPDQVTK